MENLKARKQAKRRHPKRFNATLYTYVKGVNSRYAHTYGKRNFGSASAYVDTLVEIDRKLGVSRQLTSKEVKAA